MYELTCKTCGKRFFHKNAETSCCGDECRRAYKSKIMCGKKYNTKGHKAPAAAPATVGASDKCEYNAGGDVVGYHCGYVFKTGTTRTALHPEGLTSTCYEFKPKQRKHRYQAPIK